MSFFQVYPNFSKERLVYNICSRKEFVNDVRVAAFTETASQQAYLACPKPCFRRRNWVTNEDGVSVPKEAIFEGCLTFLCQRPASDVDEPNRDVFISFEEVITYVHPRPSQTVRGLHKSPKKEPSFKTVVSLLSISDTAFLFRFNLYNGNVNDNIKLNPGHVVEHFRFDFLQKDFKMILMEL